MGRGQATHGQQMQQQLECFSESEKNVVPKQSPTVQANRNEKNIYIYIYILYINTRMNNPWDSSSSSSCLVFFFFFHCYYWAWTVRVVTYSLYMFLSLFYSYTFEIKEKITCVYVCNQLFILLCHSLVSFIFIALKLLCHILQKRQMFIRQFLINCICLHVYVDSGKTITIIGIKNNARFKFFFIDINSL